MILDKLYIIQTSRHVDARGSQDKNSIQWIAHNPSRSPPCIDRFLRLASSRPNIVFRSEAPMTAEFIGRLSDFVDILRHALRKNMTSILVVRPYNVSVDKLHRVSIPLRQQICGYRLHSEVSFLDGCVLFNHNNYFSTILTALQSCANEQEVEAVIAAAESSTESLSFESHSAEVPKELTICFPNRSLFDLPVPQDQLLEDPPYRVQSA